MGTEKANFDFVIEKYENYNNNNYFISIILWNYFELKSINIFEISKLYIKQIKWLYDTSYYIRNTLDFYIKYT